MNADRVGSIKENYGLFFHLDGESGFPDKLLCVGHTAAVNFRQERDIIIYTVKMAGH